MTWSLGTEQNANTHAQAALDRAGGGGGNSGGSYPTQGDPILGATQVPGNFTSFQNANNSLNAWAASQPGSTQQAVQAFDSAFGPNGTYNDHGLTYQGGDPYSQSGGGNSSGQIPLTQGDTSIFAPQPGGTNTPTPPLNGFGNSGEAAGMMNKGGVVPEMADGGSVPNDGDGDDDSQLPAGNDLNATTDATPDVFSDMKNVMGYVQQQFGIGAQNQQSSTFANSVNQMRPSTNVEDDRNGQIYPNAIDKYANQGFMNAKNFGAAMSGNDSNTAPVAPNEAGNMGPSPPPPTTPQMAKGGAMQAVRNAAQSFDQGGGVIPTEQESADPVGQGFAQAAQAAKSPQMAMQNPEDYRANMQEPVNQKNEAGFSPAMVAEAQNSAKGGPIQALAAGGGVIPVGNNSQPQQPQRRNPAVIRKMAAYVSGAGAAPQEHLEQSKQRVDPKMQMTPTERTAYAIASQPTMNAKAATMQAARQRYNAFRHGAAAALSRGDIARATQMATHAHGNVPNGTNITFAPKGASNGPR